MIYEIMEIFGILKVLSGIDAFKGTVININIEYTPLGLPEGEDFESIVRNVLGPALNKFADRSVDLSLRDMPDEDVTPHGN